MHSMFRCDHRRLGVVVHEFLIPDSYFSIRRAPRKRGDQ